MNQYKGKHLPQITLFYDGYIYPFIGNADLKTLIKWRTEKINSDAPWGYNKDARNTYFEHLACIEKCIKILFSNPTPEFAIKKLTKQQQKKAQNEQEAKERRQRFLNNLTDNEKKKLSAMIDTFFK